MKLLNRYREYKRSTSVNTVADRLSLLVNRTSNGFRINKIGNLEVSFLKSILPSSPVIVEVGTFNGKDTLRFARVFPRGKVFGFEPVPEIYSVAVRRCLHMRNVTIQQCAVSDITGWVKVNVSNGTSRASSSILDPDPVGKFYRGIKFMPEKQVSVPTVTLDAWRVQNGIGSIDLLWMDAQGAEGLVLKGLDSALSEVKAIYTEINFDNIYAGSMLFPELKLFLEHRGFELIKMWPDGPSGDALFLNKSFSEI